MRVCAYLGADRVLGWKKFPNQWPGFLLDCLTNVSCGIWSIITGESGAENFMEQMWFWLPMAKLKWCTSVLYNHLYIPAWAEGWTCSQSEPIGEEPYWIASPWNVKSKVLTLHFCVFTVSGLCTLYRGSLSAFQARLITLRGCMKKYFMVKCPEKIKVRIVCSLGKVNSPLKSMHTRSWSVQ